MKVRTRIAAVGVLASMALAMAVGTSSASIEPPVRRFQARYAGGYSIIPSLRPVQPGDGGHLSISAQGVAMGLGASRFTASATLGDGNSCQQLDGWAVLTQNQSSTPAAPVSLRISLTGAICTPLEGTSKSISGRYHVVEPFANGLLAGSGRFAGRMDSDGRVVVFLKGTF
jgi:hypothetical protein